MQRLRPLLNPAEISGTVVLVHMANLPAFLGRTIYFSPDDRKNLNRVFPGKPDGTLTERIAHVLTEEVIVRSDFLMDIHSGDGNEWLRPSYTGYYAEAGGAEVIESPGGWPSRSASTPSSSSRGTWIRAARSGAGPQRWPGASRPSTWSPARWA